MLVASTTSSVGRRDLPTFLDNAARRARSALISSRVPIPLLFESVRGPFGDGVMSWRACGLVRCRVSTTEQRKNNNQTNAADEIQEQERYPLAKRKTNVVSYVTWRTYVVTIRNVSTVWSVRPTGPVSSYDDGWTALIDNRARTYRRRVTSYENE